LYQLEDLLAIPTVHCSVLCSDVCYVGNNDIAVKIKCISFHLSRESHVCYVHWSIFQTDDSKDTILPNVIVQSCASQFCVFRNCQLIKVVQGDWDNILTYDCDLNNCYRFCWLHVLGGTQ